MALQAGAPAGSGRGGVNGARGQDQPLPRLEVHVARAAKVKGDGTGDADHDLLVGVAVWRVAVTRPVRPEVHAGGLSLQTAPVVDLGVHLREGIGQNRGMRDVLARLLAGELNLEEAEAELRRTQVLELGGRARLDLGRMARRGLPEVVLAEGKDPADAARLVVRLAQEQGQGLISRLSPAHWAALEAAAEGYEIVRHGASARVVRPDFSPPEGGGRVGILTAGNSDLPVAEEARMLLVAAGHEVRIEADMGVAGLHRLIGPLAEMVAWAADVLIVAAGMDGVLPGVVAGLVETPVIGVPVSTGYGMGGAGVAALHTMLQSCSTGLLVVNIDNGVGAGAAAALIAGRLGAARRTAQGRANQPPAAR